MGPALIYKYFFKYNFSFHIQFIYYLIGLIFFYLNYVTHIKKNYRVHGMNALGLLQALDDCIDRFLFNINVPCYRTDNLSHWTSLPFVVSRTHLIRRWLLNENIWACMWKGKKPTAGLFSALCLFHYISFWTSGPKVSMTDLTAVWPLTEDVFWNLHHTDPAKELCYVVGGCHTAIP